MNKRLILAGLAATGGLLTTAFLQVAVAAADTSAAADVVSAAGADAFTIGGYTFDPFLSAGTEGWDPVLQLSSAPPLLELGGGFITLFGFPLPQATQDFEVFNPGTGADLGSIEGNETVANLFGLTNAEFTVEAGTPADGATTALPTDGSVYDVFNLGNGYENVYTDLVSSTGGADTVSDELITPFGNYNLDSLFGNIDAAAGLPVGDAFTGLAVSTVTAAKDAFDIGGFTLDPITSSGVEGYDPVAAIATAPPLLDIGGGQALGADFAPQTFDVYGGTGTTPVEVGSIATNEDVTQLLGFTNTELTVTGTTVLPAGTAGELPTVGSIYDAFNFGNGYENVYTAIPGVDGANDTVTDTLVTPFGNVNLDSLFGSIDAIQALQPGDAFTGLETTGITGATDAFTIDGTTFDPTTVGGTEGFTPVDPLIGAPPFLEIGGGTPNLDGISLGVAPQNFTIYDGTGTDVGSITSSEDVTNLLGLTNTDFTIDTVTAATGDSGSSALPVAGSVYDVFNIGGGIENVYTAIPGTTGDTVTDTLVTPFGNLDLSDLFGGVDAATTLNPGDAFTAGLEALTSGLTEAGAGAASAIDPLAFLGL
jgi:hypothetical protein